MNRRTRWQGFLELVGLLIVVENKCVQQALAADLEFNLGGLLVPLYPRSWERDVSFQSGLGLSARGLKDGIGTYMKHLCVGRSGETVIC